FDGGDGCGPSDEPGALAGSGVARPLAHSGQSYVVADPAGSTVVALGPLVVHAVFRTTARSRGAPRRDRVPREVDRRRGLLPDARRGAGSDAGAGPDGVFRARQDVAPGSPAARDRLPQAASRARLRAAERGLPDPVGSAEARRLHAPAPAGRRHARGPAE